MIFYKKKKKSFNIDLQCVGIVNQLTKHSQES